MRSFIYTYGNLWDISADDESMTNGFPLRINVISDTDTRGYVPERTCKIENYYDNKELESAQEEVGCTPEDTFAYHCTACDGLFRYDRGVKPTYCPECGAKVIDNV